VTPYNVAQATNAIVNGQLTYGYAVGLRIDGIDGILFGPSYVDLMRMTSKLSGDITLYGVQRIQRCVLIDERQLSLEPIPVGEAKEVSMKAWEETAPGGLG